jgi:hypothetical protein
MGYRNITTGSWVYHYNGLMYVEFATQNFALMTSDNIRGGEFYVLPIYQDDYGAYLYAKDVDVDGIIHIEKYRLYDDDFSFNENEEDEVFFPVKEVQTEVYDWMNDDNQYNYYNITVFSTLRLPTFETTLGRKSIQSLLPHIRIRESMKDTLLDYAIELDDDTLIRQFHRIIPIPASIEPLLA